MHDEASLSEARIRLVQVVSVNTTVVKVTVDLILERENGLRHANDLTGRESALVADLNNAPVVETALPELAKVDAKRAAY